MVDRKPDASASPNRHPRTTRPDHEAGGRVKGKKILNPCFWSGGCPSLSSSTHTVNARNWCLETGILVASFDPTNTAQDYHQISMFYTFVRSTLPAGSTFNAPGSIPSGFCYCNLYARRIDIPIAAACGITLLPSQIPTVSGSSAYPLVLHHNAR